MGLFCVRCFFSLSLYSCFSTHLSYPVSQSVSPPPIPTLAPVLIPTVPDECQEVPGAPRHCFDGGEIFRCQLQVRAAATQTVTDVLPRPRDAEPTAHDDPAHRRAIQHIARCHTGHWAVVFLGNSLQGD